MLYVIDRQTDDVLTTFSNENPDATPFDDSSGGLNESLETGASTYKFDILKKFVDAQFVVAGNNVAFRDVKGQDRLLQILNVSEDKRVRTAYCVDSNLVLNNEIARSYEADKEYTAEEYIMRFLPPFSGFQVGINQLSDLKRKLKWEGMDTVTKRVRSVATQFDNAQIALRVQMNNSHVVARYIDLYKKRGKSIGETLEYGREINGIEKEEDLTDLGTAVIGEGGTVEGTETDEKITISGINYDDGRFFSPLGDDVLYDRETGSFWKKNRPGMTATDGYIKKAFSYDTQSSQELLNRMLAHLKKINKPANKYTVDVAILPESVDIGDTIRIVDHDYQPALYLDADVLELNTKQTVKGQDTVVLGNFVVRQSNIERALLSLQQQMINGFNITAKVVRSDTPPDSKQSTIWVDTSITPIPLAKTYNFTTNVWESSTPTKPSDVGAYPNTKGVEIEAQLVQFGLDLEGFTIAIAQAEANAMEYTDEREAVINESIATTKGNLQSEITEAEENAVNLAREYADSEEYIASIRTQILVANSIIAEYLKVDKAMIDKLVTNEVWAESFFANEATIAELKVQSLEAVYADIATLTTKILVTDVIKADMVDADEAFFDKIFADTAYVSKLVANEAFFSTLMAEKFVGVEIEGGTITNPFDALIEGVRHVGSNVLADAKLRSDYNVPQTNQNGFAEFGPRGLAVRIDKPNSQTTLQEFHAGFGGITMRSDWNGKMIGGSLSADDFYDSGWIQLTAINGWRFYTTETWGYVRQIGKDIFFKGLLGGKAGDFTPMNQAIALPLNQFLNYQQPDNVFLSVSSNGTGYNQHTMRAKIVDGYIVIRSASSTESFFGLNALNFTMIN